MREKPVLIQVGITERCNLKCIHCDIWRKEKKEELSSKQWLEIIERIRDWLGPYRLDITGGEPFIREDLIEIIEFCNRNEIGPVITTNATLLDKDAIRRLSEIDNLVINISLDGINQKTHDYLRGTIGTYYKVIEVLDGFKSKDRKCSITLATILMGHNVTEIINILKMVFVDGLADGVNFQALDHNFSAEYDENWYKKSRLWPSETGKNYFTFIIDELINFKKNGLFVYNPIQQLEQFKNYFTNSENKTEALCDAGDSNFIINPSGEVLLCWNTEPVGDIKKEKPEKIWNSSQADKRRAEIKKCSRTCRILNCNFNI